MKWGGILGDGAASPLHCEYCKYLPSGVCDKVLSNIVFLCVCKPQKAASAAIPVHNMKVLIIRYDRLGLSRTFDGKSPGGKILRRFFCLCCAFCLEAKDYQHWISSRGHNFCRLASCVFQWL